VRGASIDDLARCHMVIGSGIDVFVS